MKKTNLWLGILAITLVLGMAACGGGGGGPDGPDIPGGGGNNNGDGKTVTFIVLDGYPTKRTYIVGDKLDTNGLVVKAYYSDGTNQDVTGYTTDFDSSTTGTKTITFSYGGKTATSSFTVTVYAKGGSGTFNTIYDFEVWLTAQPDNTAASPHTVKLNVSSLEGDSNKAGSVGYIIRTNTNKYLALDLSGSLLTSIGDRAFSNCTGLTSVTIPNSVTSIGSSAFSVTGLTSVTIPNSVTSIGNSAFYWCHSLTSITIPDSITSIENKVFNSCSGLTDIIIPNSVTSIEYGAFEDCSSLTSITIPNNVTSIGERAFMNCTSLTSVTFQGVLSSRGIGSTAFYGLGNLSDKYLDANGGIGTYVRVKDGSAWTKQ